MPILSRDQILKPDVAPTLELVPVPEWGDGAEVFIGILSGKQRDRIEAALGAANSTNKPKESVRALMVAFAARDAENKPLFGEVDIPALGELSGVALDRLFKVSIRLNRMRAQDVAEDSEKNGQIPS